MNLLRTLGAWGLFLKPAFAAATNDGSATISAAPTKIEEALNVLGPGFVTGASDDDPSGIATYSQVGAQFGYSMGWTMLFSYPLMAAIQEISARIGCVTGKGIAGNIRRQFPAWVLYSVVFMLVAANTINLGADVGAMASAVKLLIGGPEQVYTVAFGGFCVILQVWLSYKRYVAALKWFTLSLFAYVATVMAIDVPWTEALSGTLLPSFVFDKDHAMAFVALLGTTISPYLFFWQSSHEVEELRAILGRKPLRITRAIAETEFRRIRLDTVVGMGFSNLIALFIIIATAATLNAHGITQIDTAAQAAEALRPIAGPFAFVVFACGIIGTGLLAVPVLAGASAYAVGEALGLNTGLSKAAHEAKGFYGVIAAGTAMGTALALSPIDPIKALYWSAVVNGVLAPPLMVVMMLLATNPKVMGRLSLPRSLRVLGWTATALMAAAVAVMLITNLL
jgi:NRAMP (natural resistance-associated macrophage protein)-like metal ion transporter